MSNKLSPLPCTFTRNRRLVGRMFGYFSVTTDEHAQNTHITVRYVYSVPSPRSTTGRLSHHHHTRGWTASAFHR